MGDNTLEFSIVHDHAKVLPHGLLLNLVVIKPSYKVIENKFQAPRNVFLSNKGLQAMFQMLSLCHEISLPMSRIKEVANILYQYIPCLPNHQSQALFYIVLIDLAQEDGLAYRLYFKNERSGEEVLIADDASSKTQQLSNFVRNLGVKTVNVNEAISSTSVSCPICFEDFLVDQVVSRLPCSHLYHCCCIDQWLNRENSCPMCRFRLRFMFPLVSL